MEKLKSLLLKKNIVIEKKIGSGSFGEVFKATEQNTKKNYAIKIENNNKSSRLEYEVKLYKSIKKPRGIPNIKWYGCLENKKILIMDFLGPSLDDLLEFCDGKFSLKTVCMIALQLIDRINFIHDNLIIHRDIKPDNFLIGTSKKKHIINIIDFGLSKKYINNELHIKYKKGRNFIGSFRYSSIRNHKGIEQSRRDDLESIGYMLIFFLQGRLPWQGLKGSTKSKRSKNIFTVKRNTSLNDLCKDTPIEFLEYMKYCRLLRFEQTPNYKYLRELFLNIFTKNNFNYDNIFDWNIVAKKKKRIRENNLKINEVKINEVNH